MDASLLLTSMFENKNSSVKQNLCKFEFGRLAARMAAGGSCGALGGARVSGGRHGQYAEATPDAAVFFLDTDFEMR